MPVDGFSLKFLVCILKQSAIILLHPNNPLELDITYKKPLKNHEH